MKDIITSHANTACTILHQHLPNHLKHLDLSCTKDCGEKKKTSFIHKFLSGNFSLPHTSNCLNLSFSRSEQGRLLILFIFTQRSTELKPEAESTSRTAFRKSATTPRHRLPSAAKKSQAFRVQNTWMIKKITSIWTSRKNSQIQNCRDSEFWRQIGPLSCRIS